MSGDRTIEALERRVAEAEAETARLRVELACSQDRDERFRTLAESIEDVFYVTAVNGWSLEYLSPSFERVWGRPVTELMTDLTRFFETIHPDDLPLVRANQARQASGEPVRLEYRIVRPDGAVRWILDRSFPMPGTGGARAAGIASDVTERALAEAALRESEGRFQQFAAFSADALWIRDAATLHMEYASPAVAPIYGVEPALLLGDPARWKALILPEDRSAAMGHLERVRAGQRAVGEFRVVRPSDGAVRWIRDISFPLRDANGRVQRIGGIAEDVTEARLLNERQDMLLAELQHRVRNILAVIRSILRRTHVEGQSAEEFLEHFEGRLDALARTQVLLTRSVDAQVDLHLLIHDELDAQAINEARVTLDGPAIGLPPKVAEVVTLAVHEMATNSVKYGVLGRDAGALTIVWRDEQRDGERWLHFTWTETGVPIVQALPRRRGFGTQLITERIAYELKGQGTLDLIPGGVCCTLEFPLTERGSILQTTAGQPTKGVRA